LPWRTPSDAPVIGWIVYASQKARRQVGTKLCLRLPRSRW
jgi:hypothetical protein